MKNNKNSCCKNNLCEDIVRAHIMFLSRIVKLSTHYSSPYLRRRFLSHLLHPPACYGFNYSFAIMRARIRGTTSWLGKNLLCACGNSTERGKRCMTAGVPAPISTVEIHTHMVNELPTYYGLCLCFCLCKYPGS